MADNNLLTDIIESKYLRARLESIEKNEMPFLDQAALNARVTKVINQYWIATIILRSFLSIVTLFIIWPFYNLWATKQGINSRWFTFKVTLSHPGPEDPVDWIDHMEEHIVEEEASVHEAELTKSTDLTQLPILGSGAFAVTKKYTSENETLAVKIFNDGGETDYAKEVSIIQHLNHPNIIHMIDHFSNVIVMDYAEMGDLYSFMGKSRTFAPPWVIKLELAHDIASGLAYLHGTAFVIHCDVKSKNILITWDDENKKIIAKITDFNASESSAMPTVSIAGTGAYVAPEVYAYANPFMKKHWTIKPHPNSEASDMYAYGVVAYEIGLWYPVPQLTVDAASVVILGGSRKEDYKDIHHKGLAQLVGQCWNNRHLERPRAPEVVATLTEFIEDSFDLKS